jgi:hypothetical protein
VQGLAPTTLADGDIDLSSRSTITTLFTHVLFPVLLTLIRFTPMLLSSSLLQDETSVEALPLRREASDAQRLLSVVIRMQPEVRVILDCGASILEQNNQEVAEIWLGICHASVQAVVFFADEELSVMDRAGRTEPLQTSPFAQQLHVCLV